jgi:hypothetical protein
MGFDGDNTPSLPYEPGEQRNLVSDPRAGVDDDVPRLRLGPEEGRRSVLELLWGS